MLLTLLGILIKFILQPENAEVPIIINPVPRVTRVKVVIELKALASMVVTLFGIVTEVKLVPEKAEVPIKFKSELNVMETN